MDGRAACWFPADGCFTFRFCVAGPLGVGWLGCAAILLCWLLARIHCYLQQFCVARQLNQLAGSAFDVGGRDARKHRRSHSRSHAHRRRHRRSLFAFASAFVLASARSPVFALTFALGLVGWVAPQRCYVGQSREFAVIHNNSARRGNLTNLQRLSWALGGATDANIDAATSAAARADTDTS